MFTFLCPYCNTEIPAEAGKIGSLPPTGGDYEWQESDKKHTCPNCQNTFEMRVRTSLDTGRLLFINQTPKPKDKNIVWYAVGTIEKSLWGADSNEKTLRISAVCQTKEVAEIKLFNHSKRHYQPLYLLYITSEGYFDMDGHKIEESSYYADVINYFEL
jgi:hypothetical protein